MEELYERVVELLREEAATDDAARIEKRIKELAERAAGSDRSDPEVESLLESWIVQFPHRSPGWLGVDAAIADLDSLLTGPNSTRAQVWNQLRRFAAWCFEHYVAVASLVTVFATLFYGFAYTLFFRSLNITAEQAGFTPPMLLTRSALGGLALTLIFALGLLALCVPLIPIREDKAAREEHGSGGATFLNFLITGLGCFYLAIVLALAGVAWFVALCVGAVPAVVLLFVSFRLRRPQSQLSPNLRPLEFDADKYLTVFVATALPFGLAMAALITIGSAGVLGNRAHDGWAIREPSIFGLPFIGVRVEPALVVWREGAPAGPHIPRCLLDVGTSNNNSYLYDARTGRSFAVQSAAVTLEHRNRAETCDAPLNHSLPTIHVLKNGDLRCNPGAWYTYLPPFYRYQWMNGGVLFENDARGARILANNGNLDQMRCRVVASNMFGEEVAVSGPFNARG